MASKATSRERALDPSTLPKRYEDNMHLPIRRELVRSVNGMVYLTTSGLLMADCGMKKLVANDMLPSTMV